MNSKKRFLGAVRRLLRGFASGSAFFGAALLLVIAAAGCGTGQVSSSDVKIELEPSSLNFGNVLVNSSGKSLSITVTNSGRIRAKFDVVVSDPFTVGKTALDVASGTSETLEVIFRPTLSGLAQGTLEIRGDSVKEELSLRGNGVLKTNCPADTACRIWEFDVDEGMCVETVLDDVPCANRCLENARCVKGECKGKEVNCSTGSLCLTGTCDPLRGCVQVDSSRAICPAPTDPCKAASCDDDGNCSSHQIADGVPCGPASCDSEFVCSSGVCVEQEVEEGKCPQAPLCSADGWCWENPLPIGVNFNDVAFYNGQAWAVGDGGVAIRYEGDTWVRVPTPVLHKLNSVHASEFGVWAAGDKGSLLEFRQGEFRAVPTGFAQLNFTSVWASGNEVLYLAAAQGRVWTREGNSMNEHNISGDRPSNPKLVKDGAGRMWMIGRGAAANRLLRLDENRWREEWSEGNFVLHDILPTSDGVVLTGMSFDGHKFRQMIFATNGELLEEILPPPLPSPAALFVAGDYEIGEGSSSGVWSSGRFGAVRRLAGDDWIENDSGQLQQLSVAQIEGSEGVAAGENGALARLSNATWSSLNFRADHRPHGLNGVWVEGPGNAWAVGHSGQILRSKNHRWLRIPPSAGVQSLYDIDGIGSGPSAELWVVGAQSTVLRRVAAADRFAKEPLPLDENLDVRSVYVPATNRAWVVGEDGLAFRWNGSEWREIDNQLKGDLFTVAGRSSNDIWIGGHQGLWHWNGEEISERPKPQADGTVLNITLSENEVYALSESQGKRLIFVLTQDGWAQIDGFEESGEIHKIYAESDDALWALTDHAVFRWNPDSGWKRESAAPGLRGIHSAEGTGLVAVGRQGFVLHKAP